MKQTREEKRKCLISVIVIFALITMLPLAGCGRKNVRDNESNDQIISAETDGQIDGSASERSNVDNGQTTNRVLLSRREWIGEDGTVMQLLEYERDKYGIVKSIGMYDPTTGEFDSYTSKSEIAEDSSSYQIGSDNQTWNIRFDDEGKINYISTAKSDGDKYELIFSNSENGVYLATSYDGASGDSREDYYNESFQHTVSSLYRNGEIWRNVAYRYSEKGNLISQIVYNGEGKDSVWREYTYTDDDYDERGNLLVMYEDNGDSLTKVTIPEEELEKREKGRIYNDNGDVMQEDNGQFTMYYDYYPVINDPLLAALYRLVPQDMNY